jgi:hypothetical protein
MDKKDLPASGISSRGIVIVPETGGKSNSFPPWKMQKKWCLAGFLVPYQVLLKTTVIIYHHGDLMTAVKIP